MAHFDALSVGFNCGVGVDLMRGPLESLAAISRERDQLSIPTPGCPTAWAASPATATHTAAALGEFARNGWVNIVGGCCGTTPEWIAAIGQRGRGRAAAQGPRAARLVVLQRQRGAGRPPGNQLRHDRRAHQHHRLAAVRPADQGGQLRGGACAVAREQVEDGANILDVNMDADLIDGEEAMTRFLNLSPPSRTSPRVPIMIDSSKWAVIEAGLKCVQGKAIVNSISLKEGEEKFLEQARLVKRYGAAVVVMAFDEAGPGRHRGSQGRDLRSRLQAADREGRFRPVATSSSTRTSSPSAPAWRSTTTTPSSSSRRCAG